jgi:hypothetical protein
VPRFIKISFFIAAAVSLILIWRSDYFKVRKESSSSAAQMTAAVPGAQAPVSEATGQRLETKCSPGPDFPATSDQAAISAWLATRGAALEGVHWNNYFFKDENNQPMVFHVVREANQNQVEVIRVKIFRDEEEPVFVEAKEFLDESGLNQFLDKKLARAQELLHQQVKTYSNAQGEQWKLTTENDQLTEIALNSSQRNLDCQIREAIPLCQCKPTY